MSNNHSLSLQDAFQVILKDCDHGTAMVFGRMKTHETEDVMTIYFRPRFGHESIRVIVEVNMDNLGHYLPAKNWHILAQGIALFYDKLAHAKNLLYCPLCSTKISPLALHFRLECPPSSYTPKMVLTEITCGRYPLVAIPAFGWEYIEREPCPLHINIADFQMSSWGNYLMRHERKRLGEYHHATDLADSLVFWHGFLAIIKKLVVVDYWSKP